MKVLLDTNVLIAAFIARGTCSEVLEQCARNHTLVSSKPLFHELAEKLAGKFGFTRKEAREVTALLRSKIEIVEPISSLGQAVCRDPAQRDGRVLLHLSLPAGLQYDAPIYPSAVRPGLR